MRTNISDEIDQFIRKIPHYNGNVRFFSRSTRRVDQLKNEAIEDTDRIPLLLLYFTTFNGSVRFQRRFFQNVAFRSYMLHNQ